MAASLARCFSARIILCSVLTDLEASREAQWSTAAFRDLLDLKRSKLELIARDASCCEIHVEVAAGSIIGGILSVAETARVTDLIVIHAHHSALRDYFRAGNAIRLARMAPCSVLIVRSEDGD